jgi:Barstar (barnase inhibitor)
MNESMRSLQISALKPENGAERQQNLQKMIDELSEQGIQVFYLDGKEISTKEAFLSKAAQAMKFPEYFGYNWDAFDECITDLEWFPAQRYALVYDQPDIFAKADPIGWQIARDILQAAVEYWQKTDTPMDVFLVN